MAGTGGRRYLSHAASTRHERATKQTAAFRSRRSTARDGAGRDEGVGDSRSGTVAASGPRIGRGARVWFSTLVPMADRADDLSHGPRVVLLNPDEDCSPAAFRLLVDELLAAPEPALASLEAAGVLEELRTEQEPT